MQNLWYNVVQAVLVYLTGNICQSVPEGGKMKFTSYKQKSALLGIGMIILSLIYILGGVYLASEDDQMVLICSGIFMICFSVWFLFDQLLQLCSLSDYSLVRVTLCYPLLFLKYKYNIKNFLCLRPTLRLFSLLNNFFVALATDYLLFLDYNSIVLRNSHAIIFL